MPAPVLAVDLNAAHLAVAVVDTSGNPLGTPVTVPLDLASLPASTRDGRLWAAISQPVRLAQTSYCQAVVIENVDFARQRHQGREHRGRRASRGTRGRSFRRLVAGIPTGRFRDRLAQMAANAGLAVVALDPRVHLQMGRPALAEGPRTEISRCLMPPRGGPGHRQTRARSASTATGKV